MSKNEFNTPLAKQSQNQQKNTMAKVGHTSAMLLSMVYAEIVRTGKIPVTPQVGKDDFNTARLIAISHNLPSIKVSTNASIIDMDFLENDGVYDA